MASRRGSVHLSRLLAGVGVLLALVGLVSPSECARAEDFSSSLTMTPFLPEVALGDSVSLLVTVANNSNTALPSGSLEIASSERVLSTPELLTAWLTAPEKAHSDSALLGTLSVPAILPQRSTTVTFTFPQRDFPARSQWGSMGLVATHLIGTSAISRATSSIVNRGEGAPRPIDFSVIVPLVGEPSTLGLMSAEQLTKATSPQGYLSEILSAVPDSAVTLAVDPRITTSISTLGPAAPVSASSWLNLLTESHHDGFWLPYADADLTGPLQAGAPHVITPKISDLPNVKTPSGSWPGWNPPLSNIVWPASQSIASNDLTPLDPGADSRLLVSSGNVTRESVNAHVDIEGHDSVVMSDEISRCLAQGSTAQTHFDLMASSACVASYLASSATSTSDTTVVAASFSRQVSSGFSAGGFASTLASVMQLSWVKPISLREAFDDAPGTAELVSMTQSAERLAHIGTLLASQESLSAFSTIAMEPAVIINPGNRRLSAALSNSWMNDPLWPEAVSVNTTMTHEMLNGVSIAPSSTVNMVGGQARIPIVVRNDLPSAVRVVLRASPSNGRIVIASDVPVEIEANSQIRAYLPVTARVGSGSVNVEVALFSRTGSPIGAAEIIPVNVRADWESWGLGVLGVIFALLVVAGIYRTLRRRKVHKDV